MNKFVLGIILIFSTAAFADVLRIEQDIELTDQNSYLYFSVKAPGEHGSYCNLHAYKSKQGSEESYTLKQGTVLTIVDVVSQKTFVDFDYDGKKYVRSGVTARIDNNNSYLVADCRSIKGIRKIPKAQEMVELFSDYISISRY